MNKIYYVPYSKDFIDTVIAELRQDEITIILPGQYLVEKFKEKKIDCLTYDELIPVLDGKILGDTVEKILIDIIIDKVLYEAKSRLTKAASEYILRTRLRDAISEYFFCNIKKLTCFENRHHLFNKVIEAIKNFTNFENITLSNDKLNKLVEKLHSEKLIEKIKKKLTKKVCVVLPVLYSNSVYQLIMFLMKKFNADVFIQGNKIDNSVSESHPQYYVSAFLSFLQDNNYTEVEHISLGGKELMSQQNSADDSPNITTSPKTVFQNVHDQNDEIESGIKQLMYSQQMVHLWHKEKLHHFSNVQIIDVESPAAEIEKIIELVEKYSSTSLSVVIVTKKTDKAKFIYQCLSNKMDVKTSVPKLFIDYESVKFFAILLDYLLAPENDIATVFHIMKHPQSVVWQDNSKLVLEAEKMIFMNENMYANNSVEEMISFISTEEKLLPVVQYLKILNDFKLLFLSPKKYAHLLEKNEHFGKDGASPTSFDEILSDTEKFSKMLSAHLLLYFKLSKPDDAFMKMLELLKEVNRYANLLKKEYENIMKWCFNDHYNDEIEKSSNIDVVTAIEARFIKYDLVIICDLQEKIWPPTTDEDHYFISDLTRKDHNYLPPRRYEVGYAAHDFLSLITTKNTFIVNTITSNAKEKTTESRWLSMLRAYKQIAGSREHNDSPNVTTSQSLNFQNVHNRNDVVINEKKLQITEEISVNVPLEYRPKKLSATGIEKLIRNPYLYYLEYILHLKYMPKVLPLKESFPTAKEFGIIVHEILHNLSKKITTEQSICLDYNKYYKTFTEARDECINARYKNKFIAEYRTSFWDNKLDTISTLMYGYENTLVSSSKNLITLTEQKLSCNIIADKNITITLEATADRIDNTENFTCISDYKTGSLPTKFEIISGLKPQMHLEGLIFLLNNKKINIDELDNLTQQKDIALQFIRLKGISKNDEIKNIPFEISTIASNCKYLISTFFNKNTSYISTQEYSKYVEAQIMRIHEINLKIF